MAERERQEDPALLLARLPPGRHGLPRAFVSRNQRGRLRAATIAVVAERGVNGTTIADLCAAAAVSRRTFYAFFSSKEECILATAGALVEHLRESADAAAGGGLEWPDRVAAKLRTALELFAASPDLARFSLIAPQRAGGTIAARYREAIGLTVAYLGEGRPEPPAARAPSEAVAASLIGGMVALVVRGLDADPEEGLPGLLPDLLELFLTPYLGRDRAVAAAAASRGPNETPRPFPYPPSDG